MTGVYDGETWIISGTARDENGDPLSLSGAVVRLLVASRDRIVFDLSSPDDVSITDQSSGQYEATITPEQQSSAGVAPGPHTFEVVVTLGNGTVSVQSQRTIQVMQSVLMRADGAA